MTDYYSVHEGISTDSNQICRVDEIAYVSPTTVTIAATDDVDRDQLAALLSEQAFC